PQPCLSNFTPAPATPLLHRRSSRAEASDGVPAAVPQYGEASRKRRRSGTRKSRAALHQKNALGQPSASYHQHSASTPASSSRSTTFE
ncbi:hypothetical protein PMAYCL1PPCAC_15937, partial [Pristionchus mayeri]